MDNMLGQIKYIVDMRDVIFYDHIHKHVLKRWDSMSVLIYALACVLTPKYYSPSWLAQPTPVGGVKRKLDTN